MASTQHVLLSPAELAYLHASLSLTPPVRADGRRATQFRALSAETGILPGTNGSARVCFADGTEAIVGVKAEIEKTATYGKSNGEPPESKARAGDMDMDRDGSGQAEHRGRNEWVEMSVEIPGVRDDDSATAFLAGMLSEALLADGEFSKKLFINRRFHWKLYLDILLISPPLSYPLPLLSLTTHLALLSARLPRLKSEGDEDPMFDDDWQASQYMYPRDGKDEKANSGSSRPPITLLLAAVGNNILADPTKEELAVAETVLAVSVSEIRAQTPRKKNEDDEKVPGRELRLCAVRMVDPPSRLTAPGVPSGTVPGQGDTMASTVPTVVDDAERVEGLWRAPVGGTKVEILERMISAVIEPGGAADEVLDGLEGVELS